MPASLSCACRFCASLTEVAYSPVDTMVLMVTPPGNPACVSSDLALATSRVGQGREFGSDLYAGDVIGPTTAPSPSAAVSSTCLRSIAHCRARRTLMLSNGLLRELSCSTW